MFLTRKHLSERGIVAFHRIVLLAPCHSRTHFKIVRRLKSSETKTKKKTGTNDEKRVTVKFQWKMPHENYEHFDYYIWHGLSNMRATSATPSQHIAQTEYTRKCVDNHQVCCDKIRTRSSSIPESSGMAYVTILLCVM